MTRSGAEDTLDDSEIIFRRIPRSTGWYRSDTRVVSPEAFNPRDEDVTGLSVYRAKHKTAEEAATGLSKHGYYLAVLSVGELRAAGIEIKLDDENDPGHAVLSGLTAGNRDSDAALQLKERLATQLVSRVEGPFGGPPEQIT